MGLFSKSRHARLMVGAAVGALTLGANAAWAQTKPITIAPQTLASALHDFGAQTGRQIMFTPESAASKMSRGVEGATDEEVALAELLEGTGLTWRREANVFLIVQGGSADPQSGSAAGDGADGTVDTLIVTAQKREEDIQDVPIAISAFTQEDLTRSQVAGGPDLITQIPNFSFTKTNFTSYSIQIRGIGTQAISATTDPAVAVAFNNTPFIRNRFFEQEFYDLERLEVLRGPQGTLYGRNATAGVVNIISAKPKFTTDAKASVDIGNYGSTRIEGMVNFPLVEDAVAVRLAGAWTKRDGYAFNQMTGQQIDGRDLWSTRLSLRFEPKDWISANFIWEHFEEDDDRLRSGKQLCKKDPAPTTINGLPVSAGGGTFGQQSYISQGCMAVSLYSPEAFQTPNGFALPFYGPTGNIGNPVFGGRDPYASTTQSRDLRVIESSVEPDYTAETDLVELQVSIDLTDTLTLASETAFNSDELFSLQDYNRFTTAQKAFYIGHISTPLETGLLSPDGVFCDPQLGCSDRLLLVDLSTSQSTQFSQEFRLSSDFDGPFNFSLGANFLRHDAEDKYYVFINTITMLAANLGTGTGIDYVPGVTTNIQCLGNPAEIGDIAPLGDTGFRHTFNCPYIDPNPIGSLNDQGRNYFLSKNPYKLISYAAFGEAYYELTPTLKLTGGLRFTVDKKDAPQVPSWLLASVAGPYPVAQTVEQEWREPTGRLALDWSPTVGFTDQTLIYASYAHGYKAGGANPPPPVLVLYGAGTDSIKQELIPDVFGPEFVDAFEVGAKNTLIGGALTLNLTGFYYDYEGYQTSEIRNRSAVNSNFDAEVWGLEVEADWRVNEALRLAFKGGYNGTRMVDGSKAIDLMDRTAGDSEWIVLRPFPTVPSNCVLPVDVLTAGGQFLSFLGRTGASGLCAETYYDQLDPVTGLPYDPSITDYTQAPKVGGGVLGPAYADYHGYDPTSANSGQGFYKDLSGNELPNAPNYTATVTADYALPLAGGWLVNLHGDYHYQAESWARVFNSDPYDRIEAFSTVNLAAIFTNEDAGWNVMAYVKNVFDETAITGAFLNSDDSGLTTNVFLTEPRLYGLRVTKTWSDAPFLSGLVGDGRGGPYPFQVELGGQLSRLDAGAETYNPWIPDVLAASPAVQEQDLDWGDIRDIKLTYRTDSGWQASAAWRYGKADRRARGAAYEDVPGFMFYGDASAAVYIQRDNRAITTVQGGETYEVADFMVGKEVGIGAWSEGTKSIVSAGLRYATFESTSNVGVNGITEAFNDPIVTLTPKYGVEHWNYFRMSLDSHREFEGSGPALSWESAVRLVGDDHGGHVDLDWKVGGAVLFGKQTMSSFEDRFGRYYHQVASGLQASGTFQVTLYDDLVPISRVREEDVTVPNLSLSLGLSYTINRLKLSTGYAYDRFFDVIDGGFDEAKQYDRTIHGPFLKLSVGFGGG